MTTGMLEQPGSHSTARAPGANIRDRSLGCPARLVRAVQVITTVLACAGCSGSIGLFTFESRTSAIEVDRAAPRIRAIEPGQPVMVDVNNGEWQVVGLVPFGPSLRLQVEGRWSAWTSNPLWLGSGETILHVRYRAPDGRLRQSRYPFSDRARPGDVVEVRLEDDPYEDNRSYPSDPLRIVARAD